jgi:thioredoxin 1
MPSVIDEQAFKNEVLQSPTPVLVHFWAPWCGLCHLVEPMLSRAVNESREQLKLVGINADENLRLASNYRITNLPTVMLFQEGKLLHRFDRFDRKEDLLPVVQTLLSGQVTARS